MRMNHIRLHVAEPEGFHHTFAEENKSIGVVLVIPLAIAVGSATIKKFFPADQVHGQIFSRRKHPHVAGEKLIPHFDLQAKLSLRAGCIGMIECRPVSRKKNRHLVSIVRKRSRE